MSNPTATGLLTAKVGYLRRLHERIVAYGRLLLAEHRSPFEVAVAIWLGCLVGCSPPTGLQIFMCIGLARLFRLNLPIMYGAANISIPPIVPFIGWASVQLGSFLLHGHWLTLARADFAYRALPEHIKQFFLAWLLGGAVLGAAIGFVASGAVYCILRSRSSPKSLAADPVDSAIARAADRYASTPPTYRYYARAKYRMDPCYRALCREIPAGAQVTDLGCGLGMLGLALIELGGGRRYWGVDWDAQKIAAGQLAAADLPATQITLVSGDLRSIEIPRCDVVTLVDVLHYYDAATQSLILKRAFAALTPAGQILIRETDPQRQGGARLTRWFERTMVRLGWNRGPRVYYRALDELHVELRGLGLVTTQLDVAGATHPGNVLLAAKKR